MKLLNPNVPSPTVHARKLQALVLDWAGTTVDFGSLAPARTLQKVFAEFGIRLTEAETRRDMGLPKKDHISRILSITRVQDSWRSLHGALPSAADIDAVYEAFIPQQLSCLGEYSALIPGVLDAVQGFRARGLKIGSSTGYTRAMLDLLLERSAAAGYKPDCAIAPEDVGIGRPHPFMLYEAAIRLRVYPFAAIAKAGDTPADVHEGLNAGAWSIGVAGTGNAIGISAEEFQGLSEGEQRERLANARDELTQAGAHYVVDTLADLGAVLDDIDLRLKTAEGREPIEERA